MIEIDGYGALERIGAGGLGDVYRATRVSTGSTVAIKMLRDVSDSSVAWHRMRRELSALVALGGHGNVIGVLEVLDLPPGPALVIEYAPGGSVARLLDRGDGVLTVPEAVLVGRHAARALVAAHDHGIVHRDLKPQNLLIDAYGQVKLCDFGIASLARSEEFGRRTSALSMRYASPEDLDDEAELTSASDVYSLGATLLHLVHGAPPTLKERLAPWNPPATDDAELVALDAVIADCLQPRPDARPTATDVLERLEVLDWTLARRCRALPVEGSGSTAGDRAGAGGPWSTLDVDTAAPTALRPDRPAVAPPSRSEHVTRRRRWPWVVGGLTLAAVTGAAVAWSWPAHPAPSATSATTAATTTSVTTSPVTTTSVTTSPGTTSPVTTSPGTTSLVTALDPSEHMVVSWAAPTIVARPEGLPELDPETSVWPFGAVGECLVQVNGLDELMTVDCGEPHDLQRIAVAELDGFGPDAAYTEDVRHTTDAACRAAFGDFVGVEPAGSTFSIAVTRPSAATWSKGDRRFQCLIGTPGRHVSGDAAASRP